ncbi:MAG: alkaline phosphatase D family protein [Burkholderiaceae bacterium]
MATATCLWLPRSAWSRERWSSNPFALGVASGSPTHDSVVLWSRLLLPMQDRLSHSALTVHWELAHDEGFKSIVQRGQTSALPELAHSVHVELHALAPDRWYFYRFRAGEAFSAVGRTRTLAAPGARVASLRLAYASCQRWEHGYYSAYRHMRSENLDAVLFLGDYIYESPGTARPVRQAAGNWALSLDDYRDRYALYKSDPDLQAMHAHCPWLLTWDDHEVQNDYAGWQAGNTGPGVVSFAQRRASAYQAFYEHMPIRSSSLTRSLAGLTSGAELRLYSRVRHGQLASLYLLDSRQYRDPQVCTRDGALGASLVKPEQCPLWHDPSRSLLGAQQEQWLEAEMGQAAAEQGVWNVLGQQTIFGKRDNLSGPGQIHWNDGWDGYSSARRRLTDAMQKQLLPNPVLLGGDIHENWVGHVKADYEQESSANLGVEFCGTSISSRASSGKKLPQRLAENRHFVYAQAQSRGYGVVEFTPMQLTTRLRVVDDVTKRDGAISTLAQFTVQAGRPQLELA